MYQQSIQFFWPLTEQIPLDLDYTECKQSSVYMSEGSSATFRTGSTLTVNATGTSNLIARLHTHAHSHGINERFEG